MNDENLIRRRFYLSQQSLALIDQLALEHNVSPSILLDTILKQMVENKSKSKS
jgi:hypothetical protein